MLLYQTEDGHTRIECRLQDDTLWLNQAQLAELFQSSKQNIAKHLKAVFAEGELEADAVVNSWLTTGPDGKRYRVLHYRLEAILAVGYRVRSSRGTAFRQWATAQLREYLVKGFAMDDMRLKQNGGGIYFDELLARIRDIRSSEKVFWRKVLDIYATSIDYNAATEASQQFFAALQNKMHWAAHGHTAAEVIVQRADARKPNMGLTSFAGAVPRRADAGIAKNYLDADELNALNRIVTAYLEFAELRATQRQPMTMADWIAKLDDFLRLSDRDVLTHAGRISQQAAQQKAALEYESFHARQTEQPTRIDRDFEQAIKHLPKTSPRPPKKKS
jgi:hypothetical protein